MYTGRLRRSYIMKTFLVGFLVAGFLHSWSSIRSPLSCYLVSTLLVGTRTRTYRQSVSVLYHVRYVKLPTVPTLHRLTTVCAYNLEICAGCLCACCTARTCTCTYVIPVGRYTWHRMMILQQTHTDITSTSSNM